MHVAAAVTCCFHISLRRDNEINGQTPLKTLAPSFVIIQALFAHCGPPVTFSVNKTIRRPDRNVRGSQFKPSLGTFNHYY